MNVWMNEWMNEKMNENEELFNDTDEKTENIRNKTYTSAVFFLTNST